MADIVCQPDNKMTEQQENSLIHKVAALHEFDEAWIERYLDIKNIVRLKWCMIMLNSLYKGEISEQVFNKIKDYHKLIK